MTIHVELTEQEVVTIIKALETEKRQLANEPQDIVSVEYAAVIALRNKLRYV